MSRFDSGRFGTSKFRGGRWSGVATAGLPISAVSAPVLIQDDLLAGQSASQMTNFATYTSLANYSSTLGLISSVTATEIINGTPSTPEGTNTTALTAGDTLAVAFKVTDSVGNTRTYTTLTVSIPNSANSVLIETGDYILLETGDKLLLEV